MHENFRQLKATVDWLVSEQMLVYYIQTFKDSLWPEGQWVRSSFSRNDQQKHELRIQAKTKLLESMPGQFDTSIFSCSCYGSFCMKNVMMIIELSVFLFFFLIFCKKTTMIIFVIIWRFVQVNKNKIIVKMREKKHVTFKFTWI